MVDLKLPAESRQETGKHAQGLRRQGRVPAVLYGHNLEPSNLSVDERVLVKIWRNAGKSHFIELQVDGSAAKKVLIRDLQIDPRSARPVHADFFAVNMREKMTADVPLMITGEAPAVAELKLGQLQQIMTTVKVECLPHDLPAQLTIDVSDLMEVDSHHTLGDIELPNGVTLVGHDPSELVVKIGALRVQAVEDEAATETVAEEGAEAPAAEGESGAESSSS